MSQRKVEFYRHSLGQEEWEACRSVLEGLILTTGPQCRRFEEDFAAYLGVERVVTVASCTAALELSLLGLGVGPGDEVITTPMTFVATANACLQVGARPVFVDVEPQTGNLDPALVEAAITPRTKAIMPVHLFGTMCDMEALGDIARRHGLLIISDCAHAVESQRQGHGSTYMAQASCFSFYATKSLNCGEGGAVATDDHDLAERLLQLRLHGMSSSAADRYHRAYTHWDMELLGHKANLSDIQAALLLPQLPKLEERLRRRQELALAYEEALANLPGVSYPTVPADCRPARHLFTIWAPQRDLFLTRLDQLGIGVAVNYRAVHLLSYYCQRFGFAPGSFPQAERIGDSTLSLPLYYGLTDQEAQRVIQAVRQVAEELAE